MSTKQSLDRNRTTWQRINDRCEPVFGRVVAHEIASLLLPHVVAERNDAIANHPQGIPDHQHFDSYGEMKRIDWGDLKTQELINVNEELQQHLLIKEIQIKGLTAAISGYKILHDVALGERDRARGLAVRLEAELAKPDAETRRVP